MPELDRRITAILSACFVVIIVLSGCDYVSDITSSVSSGLIFGMSICGDRLLEYPQEACDDGNYDDGDGCSHDCAVEFGWDCASENSIVGWGDNYFDQTVQHDGPFVAVAAGLNHSLGLRADGSVVGWGRNIDGQSEPQTGPFVALSAGLSHTIGLRPNGSVVGWGSNLAGQIEPQAGPFVAIATGADFSLGLMADGSAIGWGDNEMGQCNYQPGPFIAIAAGGYHSIGLLADGSVVGWGENEFGETDFKEGPFVAIAAGFHNSMGLTAGGRAVLWGDNRYQQSVSRPGPFTYVATGGFHNIGMLADGSVVGWGFNYYGQSAIKPGPFAATAGGGFHSLGLVAGGCRPVCGDGNMVGAESCDDGNLTPGDGCSATCTRERGWFCPLAGRPCVCAEGYAGEFCESCAEGYWGYPYCVVCGCDDGNVCNGAEICDPGYGCQSGIDLDCSDGKECSFDSCDPQTGCAHFIGLCFCELDDDCDDGNVCNGVGTCNVSRGACENGSPLVCDDGDVCNGAETCDPVSGCMVGVSLSCDDGRECSVDACDVTAGCVFDVSGCLCSADIDCDDGSVCDGIETCDLSPGICREGVAPDCDDGRQCSVDSCDSVQGCMIDTSMCACNSDFDCDDLSVCTGAETCEMSSGTCVPGVPLVCDDNRECSIDSCDVILGCYHDMSMCQCEVDADCDDHSVCSGVETCITQVGVCQMGSPLRCFDNRSCTVDYCDPEVGCQHDLSLCRCDVNEDCHMPFERCLLEFNQCQNVLCLPCRLDDDCGTVGNVCMPFESGSHCVVDCSDGAIKCPFGFSCESTVHGKVCVPQKGDCDCVPTARVACRQSDVWSIDSCSAPVAETVDCGDRGCVDAACCPPGTHQDGASCLSDSVDPTADSESPEATDDIVAEVAADVSPGDVSDVHTVDDGVVITGGGGCSASQRSSAGGEAVIVIMMLSAGWIVLRRTGIRLNRGRN